MKILFLTLVKFDVFNKFSLYHDLVAELSKTCQKVTVVSPIEKREKRETNLSKEGNIELLQVKTGNITKTNKIEKGINTILIEKQYQNAINKYLKEKSDLIIYSTPPMTFNNLIKKKKKENNAITYLLLKDIFPQNAVDLKMIKNKSLIWRYFRNKEVKTYGISDYIGVMSPKNKEYLIKNNEFINSKSIQIFRNATYDMTKEKIHNEHSILEMLGIDNNKNIFVYGGNVGEPQGVNNIKRVMERFKEVENSVLIIVGNGTKFIELKNTHNKADNVYIFDRLDKKIYDGLLMESDVGLIFLDEKFTIPNYPSRLTSYLNIGMPVLVSTDRNTDIGQEVEKHNAGLWNFAIDIDMFIKNANDIIADKVLYEKRSNNAKEFYNSNFKIEDNVKSLFNLVGKGSGNFEKNI